jgi:cytochrome c biogenesis protein CcmG, thiol:disulfide interchange protein DsbE
MSPAPQPRRRAPLALVLVGVVAVVLLGAVAFGALRKSDGASSTGLVQVQPVAVDGTPLPEFPGNGSADPAVGLTAPVLEGRSFDGSKVTIGGKTGKPTLLMFMAHWCPHCQREVPLVVQWRDDGTIPKDVDLVGVSTGVMSDQNNYPPSAWLDEVKWPGPVMADSGQDAASAAYGLPSYPYFVGLDADGKVVVRGTGELDQAAMQELVGLLLQGGD